MKVLLVLEVELVLLTRGVGGTGPSIDWVEETESDWFGQTR